MIRQYWSPVAASSSAKNGSLRSTSEGRSSSLSSSSSSPWYKTTNKTDWWNLTAWGNLINVFNESCVTDCAEWCRTQIENMGTSRCIHLCVPPDCVAVLTWFLWDFFCFFRSFFLSRKSSQGVSWSFPSNFFFTSCSVVSFSPARTSEIQLLNSCPHIFQYQCFSLHFGICIWEKMSVHLTTTTTMVDSVWWALLSSKQAWKVFNEQRWRIKLSNNYK